jgi:hypothetical protein
MTDATSQIAMRPPRIDDGYSRPTVQPNRFFDTTVAMARPGLEAALANVEASRRGVGAYLANMPMALMNLGQAGVGGFAGLVADLVPGDDFATERDLAREILAIPEAFMGVSPGRVANVLDDAVESGAEAARFAGARLNQPGPMPETLYSNPRFEEMIAALGRGARADRERVPREAREANDAIRADIGLPPLNPVPRSADPVPEDFGFYQDNPALKMSSGVEWLENKQRVADETYGQRRGITGSTTATLGSGDKDMFLPTDFMRRIPGLLDERRVPGEVQYERLMQDVRDRGFLPDQDGNRIVLGINHRGEAFIIEGNTRTAVASDLGIPNVRVEVRYKNGGEMVEGPFAPNNVARIAARGPEQVTFQSSARGAAVRPQVGEPFDDWIDRIYAPENRGPGNQVQDPNVVFRAMSPEEASFGETEGVFRDVSGAPLYVANDPERYVGGGAYGGRNRGRIYEFDVTDIPSETRAGGVGITERAVSEIPAERVRRVWEWVPDRRAHVLIEDRTGAPRPENFAQGGAVMMRSGMPEQIHQGLGSLSEVARRMFMGGEVSGHPLDQYGQYLTQTYAAPIQQSASQAVSQFVDSVRQKERDYFGGGGGMGAGMGGGMGAPLQGGLMGSPTDAGSTLAVGGLSAPAYSGPEIGRKRAVEPPSLGLGVPQMPMQPGVMAASPFGNNVNPHSPGMSRGDFFAPPSTDSALGRLSATNATAAFAGRGPIPNIAAPMDPRANYVTADALRSGSVFAPEHRRLV